MRFRQFVFLLTGAFIMFSHADNPVTRPSQDEARILTLVESFATLADQNAFGPLGRLFADELTVDYTSAFGGEPASVTREALMQQWAGLLPGFDTTRHALTNIRIVSIDGNKARAKADVVAQHFLGNDGFWEISGQYDYALARNLAGWQITALTLHAQSERGSRDILNIAGERAAAKLAEKTSQNPKATADAISINSPENWPKPKNPTPASLAQSPALKVVQGFFDAYGKGDMDALKQYVAEDIEWHIPGQHKLAGTKRGIDEFVTFFNALCKAGFKAEVMILAANDQYVIDAHRGWSTEGDDNVDINWVLLYQVENGKIKRVQNFSGDTYRSDAFFDRFF